MHKLLVFDLDGTLALPAKRMAEEDVQKLVALEDAGYKIVLCSGKSSYYLCGFARQLGLKDPILAGENGGTFQFGIALPPEKYAEYPYSKRAKEQILRMKELIDERCGEKIWYQPNLIGISPFPSDEETFSSLQELINEKRLELDELQIYRHWDCFDLIPNNVNKKNGILYLLDLLKWQQKDVLAVGDGANDIPMFELADVSIGVVETNKLDEQGHLVENPIRAYIDYEFTAIGEVLDFILEKNL